MRAVIRFLFFLGGLCHLYICDVMIIYLSEIDHWFQLVQDKPLEKTSTKCQWMSSWTVHTYQRYILGRQLMQWLYNFLKVLELTIPIWLWTQQEGWRWCHWGCRLHRAHDRKEAGLGALGQLVILSAHEGSHIVTTGWYLWSDCMILFHSPTAHESLILHAAPC